MNRIARKEPLAEWIKGSKVLASDGRPMVLYHGTKNLFTEFLDMENRLVHGTMKGFYFTSNKEAAAEYGPILMITLVNLKKPFIGIPIDHYREIHGIEKPGFGSKPEVFARNKAITPSIVKDWLIQQGYDGVIIPANASYFDHDEVIAFKPEQIRIMKTLDQRLEKDRGFDLSHAI